MLSDVVPKHVWSKEFRVWLLQKKEYALIDDCASQEELEEVLFNPCSTSIRSIAVRRCTPNHTTILWFVNETEKFEEVLDLATAVPAAFESLTAKEALGRGTDKHSDLMWTLINKYSARATDYLELILSSEILKERCKDDVPLLTDIAIAKKLDLMPCLASLKVEFPAVYAKVREHAMDMGNCAVRLVLKGFPLAMDTLSSTGGDAYLKSVNDLRIVAIAGELEESYDAAAWLRISYQMMDKADICSLMLSHWNSIKEHVSNAVYQQLCEKLVKNISNPHQAKQALGLLDVSFKPSIIDKLLNIVSDKGASWLSDLFPFKDWSDEQQKKAIRIMAAGKTLPKERMNEISEELQKIAFEELEIQSELTVIHSGNKEEMKELIAHKLHSRSEVALLCSGYRRADAYGQEYINNHKMDESSFADIVLRTRDDNGSSITSMPNFIRTHAAKWGLSAQNYQDLLQSPYSSLAALLKESIRKAQDGEPKSSGAVMPNKHGFVAIEET